MKFIKIKKKAGTILMTEVNGHIDKVNIKLFNFNSMKQGNYNKIETSRK